jgi:hypothetical protein
MKCLTLSFDLLFVPEVQISKQNAHDFIQKIGRSLGGNLGLLSDGFQGRLASGMPGQKARGEDRLCQGVVL